MKIRTRTVDLFTSDKRYFSTYTGNVLLFHISLALKVYETFYGKSHAFKGGRKYERHVSLFECKAKFKCIHAKPFIMFNLVSYHNKIKAGLKMSLCNLFAFFCFNRTYIL